MFLAMPGKSNIVGHAHSAMFFGPVSAARDCKRNKKAMCCTVWQCRTKNVAHLATLQSRIGTR